MYVCGIPGCGSKSKPKQSRLVHIVHRKVTDYSSEDGFRLEIDKEVPVCSDCHAKLLAGADFDTLVGTSAPQVIASPSVVVEEEASTSNWYDDMAGEDKPKESL